MDDRLAVLAAAHGVAVEYENGARQRVEVDPAVVRAILDELGADGPPAAGAVPTVVRQGSRAEVGHGTVLLETGAEVAVHGTLPELPLGWHTLRVEGRETSLAVTPAALPPVPRTWGWMTQLYAIHTPDSWGIGDYADLGALVRRAVADEAGAVLVSPVAAGALTHPVRKSPYSPSSRRFLNPLHLSVADLPEFRDADAALRARVLAAKPALGEQIDHDAVWAAKTGAFDLLTPRLPDLGSLDRATLDYATYSALAELHGPDWRVWPAGLRHPGRPEVAAARRELAGRVAFHAWLQQRAAEQLAAVHEAARGMAVGVIHDLPVGVDPGGADGWSLQDVLASRVTVGAPPDAFSPLGQDWVLPPLRPDRLAATGYLPFRDMIRAVLTHGDGIRVDHVAGLWRLWWIPPGESPDRGTYVHYDAEAMLGVLLLEAHRANAVVIGEDLGTVPEHITRTLHDTGVLSCAVAWFQRDRAGNPLPSAEYPTQAAASISTHDLPTATGFLTGEHVRVRAELGLLTDPEQEAETAKAERQAIIDLLGAEGLLPEEPTTDDIVAALHRFIARTPCTLVFAAPQDLIGEPRQPNLPGTIDQYPNWRLPLPLDVETLMNHPAVRAATTTFRTR
ncbi:4-alpha-glucanotransferase [Actinokineospora auranticolor]|uniref:4-alpha-glucanotransferase n=1 Tax=Actinokineospora auranticolor TaxID=155976 RepID=A0A2S6H089_9PSEU|nr:4-alpha-glucanotransferase [Actinokineospora auranticolor]PPK70878.1 4-alpha-glucanotransferase [Actinokineospora auranticolor]